MVPLSKILPLVLILTNVFCYSKFAEVFILGLYNKWFYLT